jgi:hypothetical protein
MYYTVNHDLHTLHTVRPGSALEAKLNGIDKSKARITVFVKNTKHSAFRVADEARGFLAMLVLNGNQG